MLVEFAVALGPVVVLTHADSRPVHQSLQGHTRSPTPGTQVIDHLVACVMGHPLSFQSAPSSFFKWTHLLHQLGDHFVLGSQLGFEPLDLALLGCRTGGLAFAFESRGGVIEQLFLPLVELGGLDLALVAEIGDRHAFDEMPFDDCYFLLAA